MKIKINETVARKVLEVVDCGLVEGIGKPEPGHMCVEAAVCYALGLPHGDDPGCVSPALRSLKIRLNDSQWSSNGERAKGLRRLSVSQLGSAGVLDDVEFCRRVAEMTIRTVVPQALRSASTAHKAVKQQKTLERAAKRCEDEGSREAALEAQTAAHAAHAAYAAAAYAAAADASAAYADAHAAAHAYASAANASAAYAYAYATSTTDAAHAAASAAYAAAYAAASAASAAAAYAASGGGGGGGGRCGGDLILSDFAEHVVQILVDMQAPGAEWLALTEGDTK